jgi:glycosyltransferase involved in cell wall biosynthesis
VTGRWLPPPPAVVPAGQFPAGPPPAQVKVLHLITRFEAGAGGNTLLSAVGMDRRRYAVWIAGGAGGPLWERAERDGIRTVQIPGFRREVAPLADLAVFLRLLRLLRRERFAIVHLHSAKATFLGRLAARLLRTPVIVVTLHGRDPWWPAPDGSGTQLREVMPRGLRTFLFLERVLRPVTHGFVAVAPSVARDAVLARIAAPGRTEVAPSAVDLDRIPEHADESVRVELGLPPGVPVVGTVGRLDAQKAPLDFVRMAALVAERRPDARFVMVGDGELATAARALADRLGLEILFTGFRLDAPRIASAFDVYVVSSLYEGVGRSVTEAMASGRPVAATAVDGVVDLITPGSTGLLAPPRDPEALAACVGWYLDHPVEAAQIGAQARARVRELFAPERMCAILDEVYSRLLGVEPPPAGRPPDGTADPGDPFPVYGAMGQAAGVGE